MDKAMPRVGDRVPVGKFFVSKFNVRVGEEFGKDEKDETLRLHLHKTTPHYSSCSFIARAKSQLNGLRINLLFHVETDMIHLSKYRISFV